MFDWNLLNINSGLQTRNSKWFEKFCDSTLTRLERVMTLKFLDDSDSKVL